MGRSTHRTPTRAWRGINSRYNYAYIKVYHNYNITDSRWREIEPHKLIGHLTLKHKLEWSSAYNFIPRFCVKSLKAIWPRSWPGTFLEFGSYKLSKSMKHISSRNIFSDNVNSTQNWLCFTQILSTCCVEISSFQLKHWWQYSYSNVLSKYFTDT